MGKGRLRAAVYAGLCAFGTMSVPCGAHAGTLTTDVVFTDYTPLSSNLELARRLLTPLTAAQLPELVAKSGKGLSEQPIDLAQEKFVVFLPAVKPATAYGLLVFVPPWDGQKLPAGWQDVLDSTGIVFVAAANSGNDANPIGRREPLALLAEANIVKRYPIDPARIYVGGFSGGSRIAMRLALAYPDVFRGALLNSGSDPIGDSVTPIPPKDLFLRFQEASRLAYVTGEDDTIVLQTGRASMHAMNEWCVFNVESRTMQRTAHATADSASLSWALDSLGKPPETGSRDLAECRAAINAGLADKFRQADALAAAGRRDEAKALLTEIDRHYGGWAVPRSVELAKSLGK